MCNIKHETSETKRVCNYPGCENIVEDPGGVECDSCIDFRIEHEQKLTGLTKAQVRAAIFPITFDPEEW